MEILRKVIPITMLAFVLSSMLSMGLSLTVAQILVPLRNFKLIVLALVANFVLMPFAAFVIARLLRLDQPLAIALVLLGTASGAPFLPLLARISKANLAFAVGDRKSTRLNSSHLGISYAVFCLKKKKIK